MLIGFGVVALWLSTFNRYIGAEDLRASILLVVFASSLLAVIYCRDRPRAFWIGFFIVMLIGFLNEPSSYAPRLRWLSELWGETIDRDTHFAAIRDTIQIVVLVSLSTVVGYIATLIYDGTNTNGNS